MKRVGVNCRVHGVVQGVGFRAWTARQARELNLSGWVKNDDDGSVLVQAAGFESDIETFVEELKVGPAGAQVSKLDLEYFVATEQEVGFRITH